MKTKKEVPAGMGMTLLMGDSEAIRRVLSTSSSSGSNWPSSSSVNKFKYLNYFWREKPLPILGGEDEKRTLFWHGFGLFCAADGRTLRFVFEAVFGASGASRGRLLLIIFVFIGNRVPFVTVGTT